MNGSRLIARCFRFIFGSRYAESTRSKFGVSAYSLINTVHHTDHWREAPFTNKSSLLLYLKHFTPLSWMKSPLSSRCFRGQMDTIVTTSVLFVIASGLEENQRQQHEFLDSLRGVINITDDICVYGCEPRSYQSYRHKRNASSNWQSCNAMQLVGMCQYLTKLWALDVPKTLGHYPQNKHVPELYKKTLQKGEIGQRCSTTRRH